MFLTAAQSLFAVAVLLNLRFGVREALLIFVLFAIQLAIPIDEVRVAFGFMYILLAIGWILRERRDVLQLFRHARAAASGEVEAAIGGEGEH